MKIDNIERVKELLTLYETEKEDKVKSFINEKADSGWNSIHWASYMGYCQLIVELVKWGGDLNAISEDGWTPLQLAVHKNNLEGFLN